jgi:hypothetical protein
MHFLKCNKCGQFNEVKNEYLVFCTSCNKKLDSNFYDWQKRNPDLSLDEYKRLVCIPEAEIPKDEPAPKPATSKKLIYWIGFSVTFALFYAIGHFGGESIVRFFKSEKTSKEVLNQKWNKETYGSFGLTVETPVQLTKGDLPMTDDVKQFVDKMEVYNYMSAKGFKILINSIRYKPAVGTVDLQGAANGSINEVKGQKGVTDFDYTENAFKKNDIPGFIQNGTYKQNGTIIEFINTGFSDDLTLWQVCVVFQADDEVGRTASKRVIESIEIRKDSTSL